MSKQQSINNEFNNDDTINPDIIGDIDTIELEYNDDDDSVSFDYLEEILFE